MSGLSRRKSNKVGWLALTIPESPRSSAGWRLPAGRGSGARRQPRSALPAAIELWADAASGAARLIVLDWQREADQPGTQSATLDPVIEAPRDDAWHRPAAHAAQRPLPRRPGILIPLPGDRD